METLGQTAGARVFVRRDDLPLIDRLPGMWAVGRDAELKIFWISRSQERMSRLPREALIGASLYGKMPAPGAEERERVIREVMQTGVVQHVYQAAFSGQRVLATLLPLDEADFGHAGVMMLLRFDPSGTVPGARTLQTPRIFSDAKMATLTRREMEILHPISHGLTSAEIGERLGRSERTVSQHLRSIHTKLGTHSRSELMFLSIEGGISGFSSEEWAALIDGEMRMRSAAELDRGKGVRGP
jgi:DNA-binding CsgD family transcriptional regulator